MADLLFPVPARAVVGEFIAERVRDGAGHDGVGASPDDASSLARARSPGRWLQPPAFENVST